MISFNEFKLLPFVSNRILWKRHLVENLLLTFKAVKDIFENWDRFLFLTLPSPNSHFQIIFQSSFPRLIKTPFNIISEHSIISLTLGRGQKLQKTKQTMTYKTAAGPNVLFPTCSMTVLLMWCLVAEPPFPFILARGSNSMLLGFTNSFLFLSSTYDNDERLLFNDSLFTLSCMVGTSTAASASLSRLISSGATLS